MVKKDKAPKISQGSLNITQLISYQATDGSWKELHLIGKLLGEAVQTLIAGESNLVAVITYLVAKWIEKHHP